MTAVSTPETMDMKTRKSLGRSHLDANRTEEALRVYAGILSDYPQDIESYSISG